MDVHHLEQTPMFLGVKAMERYIHHIPTVRIWE